MGLFQIIQILLISHIIVCECKSDYMVEHQIVSSSASSSSLWSTRGRLLIDPTARSGALSIHDWTDDEIDAWTELAKSPNSFYKLRIQISENDYLISSVLTCQLNRGDERITLHSDSNGNLIGFDYYTTNPSCSDYSGLSSSRKQSASTIPKSLQKSVEVSMSFGDRADVPFMPDYEISPPKKEQQSFWSKYWYVSLRMPKSIHNIIQ